MTADELRRFEAKIERDPKTGCWLWTGAHNGNGYGQIWVGNRRRYTHHVAYEHLVGPIPAGFFVCHRCDRPSCVNPRHLFPGTRADNMRDMAAKGRASMRLARLTPGGVRRIRQLATTGLSYASIGRRFGVSHQTISRVLSGTTWKHIQ